MSTIMKTAAIRNRVPFTGFVNDDVTLDALRRAVVAMEWPPEKCIKGGLRGAVQALSVAASPAILLVDLSDCSDPATEIDTLAEVCEPGTVVIAVGRLNDVGLYRELLARGIHDYLPKPISVSQLREALERARSLFLVARDKGGEAERSHVTAAVIGLDDLGVAVLGDGHLGLGQCHAIGWSGCCRADHRPRRHRHRFPLAHHLTHRFRAYDRIAADAGADPCSGQSGSGRWHRLAESRGWTYTRAR